MKLQKIIFLNFDKFFYLVDCSRYDERVLLKEIAAENERAFRELFDLYKERFYSVVLKMTRSNEVAEDIVQDVFLNIWSKRESLVNVDNPSSYFLLQFTDELSSLPEDSP